MRYKSFLKCRGTSALEGSTLAFGCLFAILLIIITFSASAATTSHSQVTPIRFESLLKELRCLVCQNQDLLDSHAGLALDLKQRVHQQMAAGKTDDEIRQDLVRRYGEFILFKPLIKPMTWPLWFGPLFFVCLGIGGVCVWVKRGRCHE
jgi:cytochrome c-type biogenesis protein CcmH